jgi:DNA-binding NtrC family response regulator
MKDESSHQHALPLADSSFILHPSSFILNNGGMKSRSRKKLRPEKVVGQAATPVFLIAPDRRIAFFNSGCERLTGWSADEVVGQLCEYVTHPAGESLESLAASLCPPAECFVGRPARRPTYVARKSGESLARTVTFTPLVDENDKITAVLGVLTAAEATRTTAPSGTAESLHAELAELRISWARRFSTQALVCRSDGMLRVAEQLGIARATKSAVLICGEAGSGKEHVARAIYYESDWRTRSFVPLDCKRLSPLELQQTLHRVLEPPEDEEYFRSPASLEPGMIFLAHVEHLVRDVQKKIVDAIRAPASGRDGLRLIASTTLDPGQLAADDVLRTDFYHLLTPLCIFVPPLRHRSDDLQLLAQHLLEELNRGDVRQFDGFADDVWKAFAEYNWPGNVNELLAVIREARTATEESIIRAKDLPFRFRTGLGAQGVGPAVQPPVDRLRPFLAQAEKEQIERALKQCRNNKSKAALLLGMTRPRLYRRMELLGIADQA